MQQIELKVGNVNYYFFSDDINWCKDNFGKLKNVEFVEHNNSDELAELWLMSQCKHFVIANSTYSWWGAYLGVYKEKIIIQP